MFAESKVVEKEYLYDHKNHIKTQRECNKSIPHGYSSESLFSMSTVDSCSRSSDSLNEIADSKDDMVSNSNYNQSNDNTMFKSVSYLKNNNYFIGSDKLSYEPLEKRKRRVREQQNDTISKSPQIKDFLIKMAALRLSPLSKDS